jgi:hypothetical protein
MAAGAIITNCRVEWSGNRSHRKRCMSQMILQCELQNPTDLNVLAACANTPVANNGIETDADCLALCGKQDAAINLSVLANNQPVFSCQQSTRHLSFLCINQPGYSMEPGRKQWP